MILRLITAATLIISPLIGFEDSEADSQAWRLLQLCDAKVSNLESESCGLAWSGDLSAQADHNNQETPTPVPADGQPPGERNPLVALIAAASIIVVGVTGIFIYRMIREGL